MDINAMELVGKHPIGEFNFMGQGVAVLMK
jgi:hypothetical protein